MHFDNRFSSPTTESHALFQLLRISNIKHYYHRFYPAIEEEPLVAGNQFWLEE
jgi:hypothetical protein